MKLAMRAHKVSRDKSVSDAHYIGWPTDDTRHVSFLHHNLPPSWPFHLGLRPRQTARVREGFVHQKFYSSAPPKLRVSIDIIYCPDVDAISAVDIWSAGTVMLFFLSRKFPIFAANSDMEALLEQAAILGRDVMEDTAALHSKIFPPSEVHSSKDCTDRTFSTSITTIEKRTPWSKFLQTLNPDLFNGEAAEDQASTRRRALLKHAVDLLDKCLDPDNVIRITARGALYHPFLAPDEEERAGKPTNGTMERGDDELFPHPPGQGVCADLHWRDQETCTWMAVDLEGKERVLQAGEGQAIGYMGCEVHPYAGCTEGEESPAADA